MFQEKVDDLLSFNERLGSHLAALETCKLERTVFADILEQIQKIVDDLNLRSFVNLDTWVLQLDKAVETRLLKRLKTVIVNWTVALHSYGTHTYKCHICIHTHTINISNKSLKYLVFL